MFDQNQNQSGQPVPPVAPKFGPNPFNQPQPLNQQPPQPVPAPAPAPAPAAPSNLPIDDMFSNTDQTARPGGPAIARQAFGAPVSPFNPAQPFPQVQQQPAGQFPQPAPYAPSAEELFGGRGLPWGKIISIIVILAVIAGAGFAAYWGYTYFSGLKKASPTTQQPEVETQQPTTITNTAVTAPATTTSATTTPAIVTPVETESAPDSDGDGLTDAEEKALGTNPLKADTDDDGLTDWAEVKIYHTDPLNPDTDGDGYKDGSEVIKGYDPLKPGNARLFEVPKQ